MRHAHKNAILNCVHLFFLYNGTTIVDELNNFFRSNNFLTHTIDQTTDITAIAIERINIIKSKIISPPYL